MAEWVQSRRVRVAGGVLSVAGALWVVGVGALSAWLWFDTPILTMGTHGMLPLDLFSKVYGVLGLGVAAGGLLPLLLGVFMARGHAQAARVGAWVGLFVLVAGANGWAEGGGWSLLFVALVGAVISGLPFGAWCGALLERRGRAWSAWNSGLSWLCRPIPSIATLLSLAMLFVAADALGTRFGASGREDDTREVGLRSSLTLALQCTHRLQLESSPECRELARRAPAAGAAIARAVHDCPVSTRSNASEFVGDPCAGWRIRGMFTLLGRQHAEEGFVELARWVKRPEAALELRAAAARALAEARDRRADIETATLFEMTAAAPRRDALTGDHGFEDTLEAISRLRGPQAVPLLKMVLWQHDGKWFGARGAARAIAEVDNDEAWRTLVDLADSPDADRRLLFPAVLRGWNNIDPPHVPPLAISQRARQVLLRHFDDENPQVRLSACLALVDTEVTGSRTLAALSNAGFASRPCELVWRDAAKGSRLRGLLEPSAQSGH